ncbi:probable glutathione S-transferase 7 [Nephila pilipes]|uniref:glutathione transferase n=1 Tax=Nephila pilipes TaxID=299642 RepID=A0A8X6N9W1_NEPPI|nr:probable glutathione S-transferase 7 [Nephila pilipes]
MKVRIAYSEVIQFPTIMPRYKIIDYVYPTAGELARLILQFKDVEYEDEKVDSPDRIYEAEEESPFGVLPILLVDGKIVAQQNGIARYLARELDLVGKTNEEAAICDMVMDGLGVMFSKVRGNQISKLDSKQQIALFKQMMEEDVPRYLAKYEHFLERSDISSGYLASEQLTWCDLGVALTFAGMQIRQPKLLDKYPRLKAFVDKVSLNEVVSHFIETELAPSAVLRKNSILRLLIYLEKKSFIYLKMDLPSLKPRPDVSEKVQMRESGDFSMHDTLTDGFMAVRGQLCSPHVLEQSEKKFKANAENMRLASLKSCQGIHAPLRIMHEKNAVKKTQRLPFLPSSNIALETLEGRDECIDFDDYIFTDPEEGIESLASPHMIMEKALFSSQKQY